MATKTINFILVATVFAGSLLTGCSPLQQAPLVYSSKVVVGVDVSAPTTEQPGVSINLGFKMIDAAYVPVAVAKPCEKAESGKTTPDCTNSIYELHTIVGTSEDSNEQTEDNNTKNPNATADTKDSNTEEAIKAEGINGTADNANTIAELRAKADVLGAEIKQLKAEKEIKQQAAHTSAEVATEETRKLANFPAKTEQKKAALDALNTATEETKAAVSAVTQVDKKIAKREAELASIQKKIKQKTATKYIDSYSVFGSFDSNTKTSADGTKATVEANINLGKVFSTGVAAQNLTRGLGEQFANAAIAKSACLASALKIITEFKATVGSDSEEAKKTYGEFAKSAVAACDSSKTNVTD